ncbi:MAG: hypothetical protein WC851_05095 [Candidatus Shapirobacteria bacterium]|jgi:hypothetical protein
MLTNSADKVSSCAHDPQDACFAGTYQEPEVVHLKDGTVMLMPVSARLLNEEIAAAGGFEAYQAQIRSAQGTLPIARKA